jgi:methyl-accepting chemotaxis protein
VDAATSARVQAVESIIHNTVPGLVQDVIAGMKAVPEVASVLSASTDAATLARVEATVEHMLDGSYGAAHRAARIELGQRYQAEGMAPAFTIASHGNTLASIVETYAHAARVDPEVIDHIVSLLRVGMLDLSIMVEAQEAVLVEKNNKLMNGFSSMVEEAVVDLSGHVGNLEELVGQQNANTQNQASAVAEVTSSLSELRQTSSQARDQSVEMLQISEAAYDAAERGVDTIQETVSGMESIRDQVEVIQERIQALTDQTQQIGDIIATVNEVAEQSKLLALNASIEAARAGEYGRSFSVVANEMRDLAEQSKQATRQVRELRSGIQRATTEAVVATEEGIQETERGRDSVRRTGALLEELDDAVSKTAEASRLIASVSRQQGQGVAQVADAMNDIDQSLRSSSGATETTTQTVAAFSSTVDKLLERVTTYVMFGGEEDFDDGVWAA